MLKTFLALISCSLFFWFVFAVGDESGVSVADSAVKPSIMEISSMGSRRAAHTITVLKSGRLLLVGGMVGEGEAVAKTELFDPSTVRFRVLEGPKTPRFSHTATLLNNGDVLITGGFDRKGNYLQSAEIFSAKTRTFKPAASMQTARSGHEAVLLDDGRVLIVGGQGKGWTFLSSAEIYDPSTGAFTPTGSMTLPRESHVTVKLNDGRVLVVGGHTGRRSTIQIYTETEIYDPETKRFTAAGSMRIPRHKHDGVLLTDGSVLITGGADQNDSEGTYNSVEIFSPITGLFTDAPSLKLHRYKHRGTSIQLPDGNVLLAGGTSRAELYNPRTGYSRIVPGARNLAGLFSAVAPLRDGRVLITGGYGNAQVGPIAKAWIYNP